MSTARYNVFPTRMTLGVMKQKYVGAVKGHNLLKKKSDALTMRFRALIGKIIETKEQMACLSSSSHQDYEPPRERSENVVKPKLSNTISYIISELDELEREEFFRLKKVQGKKKRDVEEEQAAQALKDASSKRSGSQASSILEEHSSKEDIIF
eukprot:tig00021294_g20029.t1